MGCCFVVVFFVCCCLLLFWGVFGGCGFRGVFFLIRGEGCLFGYFVVGPDLPTILVRPRPNSSVGHSCVTN